MQLSEDKMDALVNDCLKITEGKKHPFSKDSHVWTDMEAVVNLVLERAQADARPVAWMDDGSTRNGSESTSYRVVTDATKRNMPSPAAQAYTTPLYTHPEASAPVLSDEVERQNAGFDRCFEALGFSSDHGFERSWSSLVLEIQRALTRASAATVAEPSELPAAMADRVCRDLKFVRNVMEDVNAAMSPADVHRITIGKAIDKTLALITNLKADQQQAEPTVQRCTSCGGAKVPQTLLTTGACECEQAESANGFTVEEVIADFERVHGAGSVRDYVAQQAEPGADEREEAGSLIGDGFVLEFERWNDVTGALPRNGSWLAEVSDIIQRAAQSGQRAGVPVEAVAKAYGYLWHVNEMNADLAPFYPPAKAAYAARKVLREFLTHEQRGEAINEAGREIGRYVDESDRAAAPTQQQEGTV